MVTHQGFAQSAQQILKPPFALLPSVDYVMAMVAGVNRQEVSRLLRDTGPPEKPKVGQHGRFRSAGAPRQAKGAGFTLGGLP